MNWHLALFVFSVASLWSLWTSIVTICSAAHTFLPPWEAFNEFPTLQKYYKLFIYLIGYVALNGRSTVYPSLSTQSGQAPSKASQTAPNPEEVPKP
jgi:hypothetical protein